MNGSVLSNLLKNAGKKIAVASKDKADNTLSMMVNGSKVPIRDEAFGALRPDEWEKYVKFSKDNNGDALAGLARGYGSADDMIDDLRGAGTALYEKTGLGNRQIRDLLQREMPDMSYQDAIRMKFDDLDTSPAPGSITVDPVDDILSRVRPYSGDVPYLYHGTSTDAADAIMRGGYITGDRLPESAYRGGGHGALQASTSFTSDPKIAATFATTTNPEGSILQARMNPKANIVTIDGIDYAEELNDYADALRKQGIDGVYLDNGENEFVSLNPGMVENTGKRADVLARMLSQLDFDRMFL